MSAGIEKRSLAKASTRAHTGRAEVSYERVRAPFSLRCGALLIDYTIVVAVLAFATVLARIFGDDSARWAGDSVVALGYLAGLALVVFNFILLVGLTGRTIGKWVTGLRIERRDGERLSFWRAALRHLAGYPLSLITFGIGFLLAAFNADGLALHDRIARTVVVRDRGVARRRVR